MSSANAGSATWIAVAAGLAGSAAVLGAAYASHALANVLPPDDVRRLGLGLALQFVHALLLAELALAQALLKTRWIAVAATLALVGIVCFCGSLYAHALWGLPTTLAPIGGVALALAWIAFALAWWRGALGNSP